MDRKELHNFIDLFTMKYQDELNNGTDMRGQYEEELEAFVNSGKNVYEYFGVKTFAEGEVYLGFGGCFRIEKVTYKDDGWKRIEVTVWDKDDNESHFSEDIALDYDPNEGFLEVIMHEGRGYSPKSILTAKKKSFNSEGEWMQYVMNLNKRNVKE